MTKSIQKYGIPYRTIRYWQQQAQTLRLHYGIYAGRTHIERLAHRPGTPSREIGHAIIQLAFVASAEHVQAVLSGTRRNRWSL